MGVVAVAGAGAYLLWQYLFRKRRAPSALGPEAAQYSAQLAMLHAILTRSGHDALASLYDESALDLPLGGPPANPFGRALAHGALPPSLIRAFAESYAARNGHSIDQVACEVMDLWRAHERIWSSVVAQLVPEGDICDVLDRMRADLEEVVTAPPQGLSGGEAAELLDELSPVHRFLSQLLRRSLQLRALAEHLTRVRERLDQARMAP